MNNDKDSLSLQELEILARLYMDGSLTATEECELEYVLARSNASSPLLDGVRVLMRISPSSAAGMSEPVVRPRRIWRRCASIAASVAVAAVLATGFFHTGGRQDSVPDSPFVAVYINGRQVEQRQALRIATCERERSLAMMRAIQNESQAELENCLELIHQISKK